MNQSDEPGTEDDAGTHGLVAKRPVSWKRLWQLYNVMLVVVVAVVVLLKYDAAFLLKEPRIWLGLMLGIALANLCFLIGPITDLVVELMGWRTVFVRIAFVVLVTPIWHRCVVEFVRLQLMPKSVFLFGNGI